MNKLVKGAVATAAGIALLMGGAGTFALWNDSTTVNGGTVTSGVLTIAPNGAATWMDISADRTPDNAINIATWKIVPGDKLQMTQAITINATGNNLLARLTYDDATIVAAAGLASSQLKSNLVVTIVASGTGVTASATPNVYNVAPSASATAVTVTVTIELPSTVGDAPGSGTTAQHGSVDLSGLALKLNQYR